MALLLVGGASLGAGVVQTTSAATDEQGCPDGAIVLAKATWGEDGIWEYLVGGPTDVAIDGDGSSGTWSASTTVSHVFFAVDGGPVQAGTPNALAGNYPLTLVGGAAFANTIRTAPTTTAHWSGGPTTTALTTTTAHWSGGPTTSTTTTTVPETTTTVPETTTTAAVTYTHLLFCTPDGSETTTTGAETTTTVPETTTTEVETTTTTVPETTTTDAETTTTVPETTTTAPSDVLPATTVVLRHDDPRVGGIRTSRGLAATGGSSAPLMAFGFTLMAGGAAILMVNRLRQHQAGA